MRLLLDTESFLWWVWDDPRLPARARRRIGDRRNDVMFSVVSAWEIIEKHSSGGLELNAAADRFITAGVRENAFGVLPLHLNHVTRLSELPIHHADPFDRLLIAQAEAERLTLVTGDRAIAGYPVRIVWD